MGHQLWQPGPTLTLSSTHPAWGLGLPATAPLGDHMEVACAGGDLIPTALWQRLSKSTVPPPNSPRTVGLCWTPLFPPSRIFFPTFQILCYWSHLLLPLPKATAPILLPSLGKGMEQGRRMNKMYHLISCSRSSKSWS